MTHPHIMIVAGEASGDMHGARLVRELEKRAPDASFCGMGGKELAAAGVEILCDAAKIAVVGILEVVSHLKDIRKAMRTLENRLKDHSPHLLILIDYPDFNLMLAKKAKSLGIPVLYYISPQVWAWRSGRVKKIRRLVDRMAVILPFEQQFYQERGMTAEFVGHPLMDSVRTSMTREQFLSRNNIEEGKTIIGLLPGSRKKEIASMLPVFLKAAALFCHEQEKDEYVFLLPLARTLSIKDLENNGLAETKLDVRVIDVDRYDMMAACDATMATSGTVTLELAILGVPMVVAYRIAPITYFLGRRLIKVPYVSLVNLVADRKIVPELLQDNATPENICSALTDLVLTTESRKLMRRELASVCEQLGGPGASSRVAQLALEIVRQGPLGESPRKGL